MCRLLFPLQCWRRCLRCCCCRCCYRRYCCCHRLRSVLRRRMFLRVVCWRVHLRRRCRCCHCCCLNHCISTKSFDHKFNRHTVVLASKKHVLDISQSGNVVECVLHVHGLGDRRHGHDGSENLRRPHVVQMKPTKSILSNFKAMKHRVEGSGMRACFGRRENPRGIEGIVQLGWVSTRRDGSSRARGDATRRLRKQGITNTPPSDKTSDWRKGEREKRREFEAAIKRLMVLLNGGCERRAGLAG